MIEPYETEEVIEILKTIKEENFIPKTVIDWIIKRLRRCDELEYLKSWDDSPERMGQ